MRRDLCRLSNDHAAGPSAACTRDTDCVVRGTCCDNGARCSSTVQPGLQTFIDANFQSQGANCPTRKATSSNLTVNSQSLHVRLATSGTDKTDKENYDLLFNQSYYYHDVTDVNTTLDKVSGD